MGWCCTAVSPNIPGHDSKPRKTVARSILIADEPAHAGVTVFDGDGTALLTINLRKGADVSQMIIGLSPHQTLQLLERLSRHAGVCRKAVAEGHGGARFPDQAPVNVAPDLIPRRR